ncbi:MAG: class I adenylate-forming enzyme family protein [Acidimicrobiia bacterium]
MPDWGDLQEDQLRYMAEHFGDEVAYVDLASGASLTFSQWDQQANALARGLAARGIMPDDRVSIFMPADEALDWIVAYAAVHRAGAVVVPTNTRLSERELVAILGHAEISALLTCESMLATAASVRAAIPSCALLASTGATDGRAVTWDELFDSDISTFQVPRSLDDLADIIYTSGTTGTPKGVAVRHRNVAMIPNWNVKWTGGGWLHGAPLFTFAGIAFVYNPMKMGLRGLYMPKFDAGQWLETVERERPGWGFLVPAMCELLVAHPDFERRDLSSLQQVSIGSAPIAPETLRTMQQRLPQATVNNSYGMTEAGPAYILMPKDEQAKRVGSVGKPIPPMEIKIVDEAGAELAANEVGELLTRMPGKQREYYKDDAASESTWTADGWLRSGDLAYVDDDGFLYICGRKKDLIIRGGNNVYPTDIEAVLLEHPQVQEAAVVGIPHDVLGEDIGAYVVLTGGATLSDEDLKAFCADRLADYKRPRQITFVTELPRNATGKVMKHVLRSTNQSN